MQADVTRDLNLATTLCVRPIFGAPRRCTIRRLVQNWVKANTTCCFTCQGDRKPSADRKTKQNKTKAKPKERKRDRTGKLPPEVCAGKNNNAQCCWHTVTHAICSPGHSSARALAVEQPTMNILLFLFPFLLLLPRSCPHTTSLMALMKLTDCTRSSLKPQSLSASVAPCSQSCSLWSPKRAAHFGAPELLCKRGS